MNKRDAVRYSSKLLPESMSKVTILWDGNPPIEANVMNYCAHGMRVIIPPLHAPNKKARESETVLVQVSSDETWFTGMCVSATKGQDSSISLGIYFYNPSEQNYLRELLNKSLSENYQPSTFVSYQWEEIVDKLCDSEDSHLKEIGCKAKDILRIRQKLSSVYRNTSVDSADP